MHELCCGALGGVGDKLVHHHHRSKQLPKGSKAQEPAEVAQRLHLRNVSNAKTITSSAKKPAIA